MAYDCLVLNIKMSAWGISLQKSQAAIIIIISIFSSFLFLHDTEIMDLASRVLTSNLD